MLGLLLENFHHLLTTILWNILTLSLSFNIVNSKFVFLRQYWGGCYRYLSTFNFISFLRPIEEHGEYVGMDRKIDSMYKCLFENHFWIIISNSITFHCTALHCSSLLLHTALHLFISLSFFVSRFIYRLRSYIFGIFRRNLSQFSHFFRSSNSVIFLLFKCWCWWWMEVSSTKTVIRQFEVDLK